MERRTARWTLRVTATHDAAVPGGYDATGESPNEYGMRQAVDAATNDLADRKVFVVDEAAWGELKVLLDRPQAKRPELSRLLENASVLETGNR